MPQSESGRRALKGTGIHEVDLTRHIAGKDIRSVAGFSNQLGELGFPKDKTTSAVTYEGRWPARKFIDDHLRILRTKSSVFGNRIYTEGQDDWKEIPVGKNVIVTSIKGCVDTFVHSVTSNAPIAVTGEDTFTTLAAAVVCVSSSRMTVTASPASAATQEMATPC